jgi:HlyD family secretion protein
MTRLSRLPWLALASLTACGGSTPNEFQGYVEGEFVNVAAAQPGRLERLDVQRGAAVEAGDPLFVLDAQFEAAAERGARDRLAAAEARLADLRAGERPQEQAVIRAQLAQARAEAERSALQLKRDEDSFPGGAISQARLDDSRAAAAAGAARVREVEGQLAVARLGSRRQQIEAQTAEVAAARAALEQAQWTLNQKAVTARDGGLVQDTLFRVGEWVLAGSPVVRLLPPTNVKVRFFVPEPLIGALAAGAAVTIACDGCGEPMAASIRFVSTEAEYTPPVIFSNETRAKLVFLVEAQPSRADAVRLRPGQPVSVTLQ